MFFKVNNKDSRTTSNNFGYVLPLFWMRHLVKKDEAKIFKNDFF